MLSCEEEEYVDIVADAARLPIVDASVEKGLTPNEPVGCGLITVLDGCVFNGEYGDTYGDKGAAK